MKKKAKPIDKCKGDIIRLMYFVGFTFFLIDCLIPLSGDNFLNHFLIQIMSDTCIEITSVAINIIMTVLSIFLLVRVVKNKSIRNDEELKRIIEEIKENKSI